MIRLGAGQNGSSGTRPQMAHFDPVPNEPCDDEPHGALEVLGLPGAVAVLLLHHVAGQRAASVGRPPH